MSQTSSSSIWDSLGAGAIDAGLSYAQSKGIDVPANTGNMVQPDVAAGYYGYGTGQVIGQPTVGYAAQTSSSGMSTVLLIGGVLVVGALIFFALRR